MEEEEDRFTRITLRIPKDIHQKVSQAADDAARSTNAEIVARLQQSFMLWRGIDDLRREMEHLQTLANERQHAAELLGILNTALAQIVHRIIEDMPQEQRSSPDVRAWLSLANSIVHKQGRSLADVLAPMLGASEGPLNEAQQREESPRVIGSYGAGKTSSLVDAALAAAPAAKPSRVQKYGATPAKKKRPT